MPASSSILKEFVVKIGFTVDETRFRRFQEVMHKTSIRFAEMAKTGAVAAAGLGIATAKVAKQLEGLYYAAQRTGASAGELKTFGFAAPHGRGYSSNGRESYG